MPRRAWGGGRRRESRASRDAGSRGERRPSLPLPKGLDQDSESSRGRGWNGKTGQIPVARGSLKGFGHRGQPRRDSRETSGNRLRAGCRDAGSSSAGTPTRQTNPFLRRDMKDTIDWNGAIADAWKVREAAHAPYSNFKVGAVVIAADGNRFAGCNVENLSYGLTICAERAAVVSAVASGHRQFAGVVVVADTREPISPCGACRQVLAEFGDCVFMSATKDGEVFRSRISELLPRATTGILDRA